MAGAWEKIGWQGVAAVSTVIIAVATGIYAFFSWGLWVETSETKKILADGQRAWLAPGTLEPPKSWDLPPDQFVEVRFSYGNVGKEPARKVHEVIKWTTLKKSDWKNRVAIQQTIQNLFDKEKCADYGLNPNGRAFFPGDVRTYASVLGFDRDSAKRVMSKEYFPFIAGCFVYETIGSTRYTNFCLILEKVAEPADREWRTSVCPIHNDAN